MPQVGPRSLYFDVTGDARAEKVKLPSCIRSSKPGALPNTQVCTIPPPPIAHFPTHRCEPSLVPPSPLSNTHTQPRSQGSLFLPRLQAREKAWERGCLKGY